MSPNENTPFEYDSDVYNKPIKAVPTPPREIGIDTENNFYHNIVDAYQVSQLNLSAIDAFTRVAQTREEVYSLLDTMTEDSIVATALSIYSADATEYNDQGRIVWCESSNDSAAKYITFLLDTLNVDKYVYKWVYNLCKYGDVYLRLYRESESEDPIFGNKDKKVLQEDVNIKAFKNDDKYIHYVEMVKNPAEMFELTRMGKTVGYIQAKVPVNQFKTDALTNNYFRYNINRGDVDVYQATEFVHASLDDVSNRTTEEVDIFTEDSENPSAKYNVKRGQSLLYNLFKVWREKMLLENSIMLNRVTKSSITRLLQIEVGDMPKEQVTKTMSRVKTLIEQKSALNLNQSMTEYTNPGPIENTVYMPTHNGVGAITMQTVGGDVDVKGLADLDHIMDQFYGALGIPKQFLGCLRGNTPILLLNGHKLTVEELYNNREEYIGKGIMACDSEGNLVPTTISNVMLTKPSTGFYRIHLDNGEYVDVTHDHRMMLRNGKYILAEDLKIGDSLMPYYDYIKDGRRFVLDNKKGKYRQQYRVVAESIWDIPSGYQVHHKNAIKIDDDFDNLEPLSVSEHCRKHLRDTHQKNKENRLAGIHTKQFGARMINNGVHQYWLHDGDELPVGYEYGMLPFTEEHKRKISEALAGKPKNYDCIANFGDNFTKKTIATKRERKLLGLYDEQYGALRERLRRDAINKTGWYSEESKAKRMARFPENRRNKYRYVRCLCCGNIEKIKCNDDWYNDYLNERIFWFCSKECSKLNGGGKLARSYQLYLNADCNSDKYEYLRCNGKCRPDTYFKYSTLENILPYINNYVPNCNHQVIAIEYIDVNEPAYDISVSADCHTFALPCGIFVHNCTDDNAGFNGGASLAQISARYAKTVKRLQNSICSMITDMVNLMLINKGLDNYVNSFTIRMQAPATQEEINRMDNKQKQLSNIADIMNLVGDIQEDSIKLKILKNLLSTVITDPEVISYVQDEIDRIESSVEDGEEVAAINDEEPEKVNIDIDNHMPSSHVDSEPSFSLERTQEIEPVKADSSEETVLPSPADLGMDFTDLDNM